MARIQIEDLSPVESLSAEETEDIFSAGRKSFHPELQALQTREMMDAGIGQSLLPQGLGLAGPQSTLERRLQRPRPPSCRWTTGSSAPWRRPNDALAGAFAADPLEKFHRQYVGARATSRKGDILPNTTKGLDSESIQFFGGSKFNHAAVYVGDGMVGRRLVGECGFST